jgi:tetratricopeptide (TPR) repeat protein
MIPATLLCLVLLAADASPEPALGKAAPASAARGDQAVAPAPDVDALVRDLGAEAYDRREAATEALRKIGLPALKALEKAAESDDPEVNVRARKLLADIRLGVTPDWPADLVLLARHYEQMTDRNERYEAMRRISQTLREKAVPFLVLRMESDDPNESQNALSYFRSYGSDDAYRKFIELVKEPKNAAQTQALAYARMRLGMTLEALESLGTGQIDENTRRQILEAGVRDVQKQLSEGKYGDVSQTAARFAKVAPSEARFLYLQAEALVALDEQEQAEALRKQALALNPDKKAPHYSAGEMLLSLGRRVLSEREWQMILKVPPVGDVYDINAYMRLWPIYEASGLYAQAADALDQGLTLYTKAREAGRGMGLTGGSEQDLRRQLEELRQKAKDRPSPNAKVADVLGEEGLHVNIIVLVKDGKAAEMQKQLASVAGTLTLKVEPRDLRLFDVAPASLRYDPEKKLIVPTLNGQPCCEPVPFEIKTEKARVGVNTGDCCYIFEIDATTGKAEKLARYEKDYTVRLTPGIRIKAMTSINVKVNEKALDWTKLLEGVEFDVLPDTLDITLEGTTPKGRRITIRMKIPTVEPAVPLPRVQPVTPQRLRTSGVNA